MGLQDSKINIVLTMVVGRSQSYDFNFLCTMCNAK